MKNKTAKLGLESLVLGLALVSLSFIQGFKADSISATISEGVIAVKVAVIVGLVLIVFAAGCFAVAVSIEK